MGLVMGMSPKVSTATMFKAAPIAPTAMGLLVETKEGAVKVCTLHQIDWQF